MAQYSLHDAKIHLSRLIAEAVSGEEVVIMHGKVPVVRLSPVPPPGRRKFGAFKGQIAMDDRFNDPLPPEHWEGRSLA